MATGSLLILMAGAIGWLPGPGGIPLFLLGIAVLASEFNWAERLRDKILDWLAIIGKWIKSHKVLGFSALVLASCSMAVFAYLFYIK